MIISIKFFGLVTWRMVNNKCLTFQKFLFDTSKGTSLLAKREKMFMRKNHTSKTKNHYNDLIMKRESIMIKLCRDCGTELKNVHGNKILCDECAKISTKESMRLAMQRKRTKDKKLYVRPHINAELPLAMDLSGSFRQVDEEILLTHNDISVTHDRLSAHNHIDESGNIYMSKKPYLGINPIWTYWAYMNGEIEKLNKELFDKSWNKEKYAIKAEKRRIGL